MEAVGERLNFYQCGRRAFRDGREINDNDYTPGNGPWREWRDGWFDERAKSEGLYDPDL
jgi:hypothetical protein